MQYRRNLLPGGTYKRAPILAEDQAVETLRAALRYTLKKHPFEIIAAVILPDHLHMLWRLPGTDCDIQPAGG